jgi:hypothetical protein
MGALFKPPHATGLNANDEGLAVAADDDLFIGYFPRLMRRA